jgi:glucose/arabinose dehydrogenase
MRVFQLISCTVVLLLVTTYAQGATRSVPTSSLALEAVVEEGLFHPTYVAAPPDGSERLFVLEQSGRIRIVQSTTLVDQPFLDISAKVLSAGSEQGLLGLAFHPDYRTNGRYFVNYTRLPDGATVIAEYHASSDASRSSDTERVLLTIPQPYRNHKGGMVEFGPDGLLYIGMGDGGSGGDPQNRAQNLYDLLGKMLRIDVDHGDPYAIPDTNPFAKDNGRPEIYASGFRNPWRFSFDRDTADLWAADVGQNDWEEIDVVRLGGNYGWRIMEGMHCFSPKAGCHSDGLILPIAEYPTRSPRCSIIGGYVYRGKRMPSMKGIYVYGDFCSGEIFGFKDGHASTLLTSGLRITSFGQDESGELYVAGHGGTIHRLVFHDRTLP